MPDVKWLGQLNEKHGEMMSEIEEVIDLLSPDEAWKRIVSEYPMICKKGFELIDPFYGKEPTITKSKKSKI